MNSLHIFHAKTKHCSVTSCISTMTRIHMVILTILCSGMFIIYFTSTISTNTNGILSKQNLTHNFRDVTEDAVKTIKPKTATTTTATTTTTQPTTTTTTLSPVKTRIYQSLSKLLEGNVADSIANSPEKLKNFVYLKNLQQHVYNKDKFHQTNIVIVVQVHDRLLYLKEMIKSLSETSGIEEALVIFSHNHYNSTINQEIQNVTFCKVMQIFFPYSLQIYPQQYPGPDPPRSYVSRNRASQERFNRNCLKLNERNKSAHLKQLKLHWWWKLNFVFEKVDILKNYDGTVILLEEDHYVAPDCLFVLNKMKEHARSYCSECQLFSLATHQHEYISFNLAHTAMIQYGMDNFGLSFNRAVWYRIKKFADDFCKYDDYNWDFSLQYLLKNKIRPRILSMVSMAPRVHHIGLCGTHVKTAFSCDPQQTINQYKRGFVNNLFPSKIDVIQDDSEVYISVNGGWSDPRDQVLCMAM